MKNILKLTLSSFLSGFLVGIGGIIFIYCKGSFTNGAILGSFLFSLALLLILEYELDLYTGKLCYFFQKETKYKLNLFVILVGNIIGAAAIGYFISLLKSDLLNSVVTDIVNTKLSIGLFPAFISSFMCGIIIFFAVDTAKRNDNQFFKALIVVLCIMLFILAGFDHSIANTFYFSLANKWNLEIILYFLIIVLGNFVGGVFFPSLLSLINKHKKVEDGNN